MASLPLSNFREIHPLHPQPHRHSMLVPRVCAPRVTLCRLGKYWSCDRFRGNFSLTQGLWNQQAANPGVHRLSMTHSGVGQQNLMMHAQCQLPVYYSQVLFKCKGDMSACRSIYPLQKKTAFPFKIYYVMWQTIFLEQGPQGCFSSQIFFTNILLYLFDIQFKAVSPRVCSRCTQVKQCSSVR